MIAAALWATPAWAAVLETPTLNIGNTQEPGCIVVNTGPKEISVSIRLIDADGDDHLCAGGFPTVSPAGSRPRNA